MQSALVRLVPRARQVVSQPRLMSTNVVSPPLKRFSFAEKVVHGVIIAFGLLATPAWVLVNMKHYRGLK